MPWCVVLTDGHGILKSLLVRQCVCARLAFYGMLKSLRVRPCVWAPALYQIKNGGQVGTVFNGDSDLDDDVVEMGAPWFEATWGR